ncbi:MULTISPECIES: LysR family transcriptional regulator [Micromonospora]|uniref:LysR family transcriptional regulator n=1 Tax=Micromonospora sicca TaxID=2202420 RepID=A0A317CYK7_9ACTN|nr:MULTISPECIES: LysR family transcriptional regulator [unclassified Micromonospora]MBM0227417.1 LysR family transcriptional regulator [Micromonospora sp. ATA51]PWR06606.1 LysR family transcriptional regulator [Micromonospora sp. 4G51]
MGLDVERLRVLVEVVHAGSIAAAAKRMGFTASALSQQLAKLEREVGDRLVDRGPGGVRPTATGELLVRHGERVLGALHDAEEAVRGARRLPREHLSVGTFASAGKALVPTALATFRRAHPQVRLTLLDIEPPDGYGLVTSGDLDLLITHRYPDVPLPPATGLHRAHLMADPLRLVLPTGHRHAGTDRLTLAGLATDEWISGGPGVPNRVALDGTARRAGVELRVSYETRDYAVTLALVSAGIGVAVVPGTTLRSAEPGDYVVRDLDQPIARDIFLVHRPRPRPPVSDMVARLQGVA